MVDIGKHGRKVCYNPPGAPMVWQMHRWTEDNSA
jgi:hypothetical protein